MSTSSPPPDNGANIAPPDNFVPFWKDTVAELNDTPAAAQHTVTHQDDKIEHSAIEFTSWQNTVIRGYLLRWRDHQPRPLVIYTHGYNGQCNSEWAWAKLGLNVFGFDTRGFGRSPLPTHRDGWILTGIESQLNCILRGAVCDFLRAAEVARQLTGPATSRTLYYGYSFGGAMALMGEALGQAADVVAAGVPSFGWMAGRRKLVKLGSGAEINRHIRLNPDQETQIMETLSYFDTAHFAAMIGKPTLIGIGQHDIVVPAQTVWAICQNLRCPTVIREFPYSHSNKVEEQLWQNFDRDWQHMALTGQLP